jgi:hypothetical protein
MKSPLKKVSLALGALAVLTPAAALGRAKPAVPSHRVNLTGVIETLSSTGPIATLGTKDTDAGILDGTVTASPRWSGALRQVVTWGSGLAITAKGTAFNGDGSLRFTLTGKFAGRPAGGLGLTGKMTVTGGTGRYQHAQGTLRVTGIATIAPGVTKSTFDLAGSLRYPQTR